MKRRDFLKTAGVFACSYLCPTVTAWALRTSTGQEATNKLVVVFLRGAVDGLSVVIPYGDARYYASRTSIAIQRPGQELGALDLNGYFGLHPSLKPMHEYWANGTLAFVHAAGSPDPTRSHFDAQDYMESGTPGIKITSTGWMNRLLSQLPNTHSPIRAINIGATAPRIMQGPASIASYAPHSQKGRRRLNAIDNQTVSYYFQQMYSSRKDALAKAFNEGLSARTTLKKEFESEMIAANAGAPDAAGFRSFGTQLGQLMSKDPAIQMGFIAIGGWDTHVNQGSSQGQLANKLAVLGKGLKEMVTALGQAYNNTVIVVLSEFGRTVSENGNTGTDHGHGNVIMLLGGKINGSQIHGRWAGLQPSNLFEGRDLPVTTDFRSVLVSVISEHMQVSKAAMQSVFPGFQLIGQPLELLRG
ncbi:MAG: DUF1501 domain-containing protein [Candidatus Melainabacteria bacterium]|nr:DUF1501 domain-containing protein [Candidatus Melainabacteria bacterium]